MFYKLANFLGCNKLEKMVSKPDRSILTALPMLETDNTLNDEPSLVRNLEIYGYTKPGYGLRKVECQDTFVTIPHLTPNMHFLAIYDGHGSRGKHVSEFVNKRISKYFKDNATEIERLSDKNHIATVFKRSFGLTEQKLLNSSGINVTNSGTCCIDLLIYKDLCFIANLGDSRAVLCRKGKDDQIGVIELSKDHKPTREEEKTRILEMGGMIDTMYYRGEPVGPMRVWDQDRASGVAMTRAMGDTQKKRVGLISEPEVHRIDLNPNDKFIIVGSDGLWDVMTSKEAVSFVNNYVESGKPKDEIGTAITKEAQIRWKKTESEKGEPYCDDITVIIAFLHFDEQAQDVPTMSTLP